MWKDAVNKGLQALTGYQLENARAAADRQRQEEARRAAAKKAAAAKRAAEKKAAAKRAAAKKAAAEKKAAAAKKAAERKAAAKAQGRPIPQHYDDAAKRILSEVRPRTMTTWEKLYGLVLATRYVVAHDVPGAIVECGVWRGGSMQATAYTLLENDCRDRDLHLFDTFEGMPPPTEEDRRHDGTSAAELLEKSEESKQSEKVWAIAGLDDVKEGMAATGYPEERIHYHEGMVEDTVPGQAPEQIAILRLDTDWYASTKHELEHLYSRLVPGGVLILDDYGHWQGARQATEEFLAATGEPLLLLPLSDGRIAIKR